MSANTAAPQEPTPQQATPAAPAPDAQNPPQPVEGMVNAQVGGQFHNASLYVGDLHPEVTEAMLFDIFNAVGPVASVRVCRDAVTRRSLGYAYVNFHSVTDAERALDTMNYFTIKGRPIRMMWSQRDPSLRKTGAGNVFVKDLDLSIDNKALFDTFSLFGNILSCKVVTDKAGKSKGYGFVHFETVEAAEEAIRKIDGMLIANKKVYVAKFVKRNERPGNDKWTNLYVKNIPLSWDDKKLEDVFSASGAVSSAVVMVDSSTGKSRGFGFVDFVEHDAAVKAIEEFNDKEIERDEAENKETEEPKAEDKKEEGEITEDNKETEGEGETTPEKKNNKLVVCRAQKKSERERELQQKFEQLKADRLKKYQGVNLYVRNLHEDVDDDLLRKEFTEFGEITSARVMRETVTTPEGKKEAGPSKGFGFVCFSTTDEATKAVTEMNGKMILGKPIYVALAQRKEARRAQLEVQHQQRSAGRMPMQPNMYPGNQMFYPQGGMAPQARPGFPYGMPQMMPRGMVPPQGMAGFPRGFPVPQQGGYMPQGAMQGNPQQTGAQNGRGQRNDRRGRGQPQQARVAGRANAPAPTPAAPAKQAGALPALNSALLAEASEEQQKNMIGERLYPLIQAVQPQLAGKITGMLLEMDNAELLHLLESKQALDAKITEAMQVLDAHQPK